MKKQILNNVLPLLTRLLPVLLMLILMGTGCNKKTKDDNDSLDKVLVIVQYEQLSLIGTDWKLIGFANVAENTIKIAEPQQENCYRLIFNPDGTLSGETSTNQAGGGYEVNMEDKVLKILSFGGETMINELYDGFLYIESMLKVESFAITERGLALYYDNKKHFLLFKPVTL